MPQPYQLHYSTSNTFWLDGNSKSVQVFPWQLILLIQSLDFSCMVILFDLIVYFKIAAKNFV